MKITEQEVRYVADLANLKLTDQEIGRLSKDLDEILIMSDRVATMYEGRFTAILAAPEATRERVGLLMAGADGVPVAVVPET